MELLLPDADPWNTVFLLDGQPIYHVETHIGLLSRGNTVIKKMSGMRSAEMSIIDSRSSWGDNVVKVWGKNVAPQRGGFISTSETFVGSDGYEYKWKNEGNMLALFNSEGGLVASFDPGSSGFFSKPTAPKLSVSPQVVPILDEIVATWTYMQQKKRTRKRRRNRRVTMFQ